MNGEVRDIVPRGRGLIDQNKPVAGVFVKERRGGIDRQARAGDDEQIRTADGVERAGDGVSVKRLLVEHHVGLHPAAADGAHGDVVHRHELL